MSEFIFGTDRRVFSKDLMHCMNFKAGVAREVPPTMESAVLAAGGMPSSMVGGKVTEPPQKESLDADKILSIAEAMQNIIDENDEKLLTNAGFPRANELEKRLGFDTSADERDAAWDMVGGK